LVVIVHCRWWRFISIVLPPYSFFGDFFVVVVARS